MSKRIRYTYQDILNIFENEGYEVLSTEKELLNEKGFIYAKTKILVKCTNSNHEPYFTNIDNFKNGRRRCKRCKEQQNAELYKRKTYEEIKEYIESFGYKMLSKEYINAHEKLLIQCDENHIYETTYNCFQRGQRCPECNKEKMKNLKTHSYEYIKTYIENEGYRLLSKTYEKSKKKIKLLCPNNHEWNVTFDSFQQGHRCPICNISKGERRIMDWLDKNNIKYIYSQPYFNNLIGIGGEPLRPDFILVDYNMWIEYDGDFHFRKVYYNDNYETIQTHDNLKNNYAIKNGWKLIRISYWDFDSIEEILEKIFKIK